MSMPVEIIGSYTSITFSVLSEGFNSTATQSSRGVGAVVTEVIAL